MLATEASLRKILREDDKKAAIKALVAKAEDAEDLAKKLRRYADELKRPERSASTMPVSDDTRFNWAINEIENFIRNINFATLARHNASLRETP